MILYLNQILDLTKQVHQFPIPLGKKNHQQVSRQSDPVPPRASRGIFRRLDLRGAGGGWRGGRGGRGGHVVRRALFG